MQNEVKNKLRKGNKTEIKRMHKLMDINTRINSQLTLSDTAHVIVNSLREVGFDRAGIWIRRSNEEQVHGIWGTNYEGKVYKNEHETYSASSIPTDDGYTVVADQSILQEKLGVDQPSVFLYKGKDEDKFESIWGYYPPFPGFYKRDERGDNICICVKAGDKRIGIVAVDNYITGRNIDETSANILNIIGAGMTRALVNFALRESLAAEKERIAVTLRSIGDGVITTDTEGNVTLMNRVAEKLTGWTEEEAVGKQLTEVFKIINERNREKLENPVKKVLETGEVAEFANNTILLAKDSTEFVITDSCATVRDEEGSIIGVIVVFSDITEKRRVENELIKTDKLESIGILAGGIAHDFNNILTGILGNISLAKMYSTPGDKVYERLLDAEKSSMEAKKLTQQLLTFSEGGTPVLKLTSIRDILNDSVSFALKGSKIRCAFDIPNDLWPVEVDVGQISQAINNIVINADQAMPKGGVIKVGARNINIESKGVLPLKAGKYVKIYIEDNGIGIQKEYLQKVFDPYFTTKQKGSGLGLATAYSIIKKHNGHIAVDSEISVGTTFYIYLPAESEKEIPKEIAVEEGNILTGLKILVMDDQEIIRELTKNILGNLGHKVTFAIDGFEAIENCRLEKELDDPYDVVIMDLTIPGGMGGKEAIKSLLQIAPETKVIVSSGYSNDPVLSDYEQYGFSGFIAKPYRNKELIEVLQKVMSKK
ncbi:MAG: two-component system, cell cycle sensor histidine kinase and response regulator CckA [Candidatus Poribacteria bacterium]|nr:two-component system, cell cycle sensor histidine kinase and response regulator CckA [Candidatus Poribacteria bacterium]